MLVHLMYTFFLSSAVAAPAGDYSLDSLQRQVESFEKDFKSIQQNYTNRVGLLSAADADTMFDNGLYAFMFEQYEKSALNFFALQIDKSFQGRQKMSNQSDWYLIESTFLMENLSTAEQACLKIIEKRNHPFFGDAIRRVLEIYGLRNQPNKYQEIYNQYVLTGIVAPSPEINYSVGKSLFWQGKIDESKRSLTDISQDSDLFHSERNSPGYVGHEPLQAYSTQNGILMVSGGPKRYAIKMVFKWFWGVQKGMLKKWSLNSFGGSKKACYKNSL